jgi:hypothetical protein
MRIGRRWLIQPYPQLLLGTIINKSPTNIQHNGTPGEPRYYSQIGLKSGLLLVGPVSIPDKSRMET